MKLNWIKKDRWIAETNKGQYEIFIDTSNNSIYKPVFIIKGEMFGKILKKSESIQEAITICQNHYNEHYESQIKINEYLNFIKEQIT